MIEYSKFNEIFSMREQGHSVVTIAKDLGIDAKTVMRYLKKESYEKQYRPNTNSIMDPFMDVVKRGIVMDLSAAKIFEQARDKGFAGSESLVRGVVAKMRPKKTEPMLTLSFAPGEAAQADFALCGKIMVGDTPRRLRAFVMTLCQSRMIYAKFILSESMEHFLQGHRDAFEFFGGVPSKIMVDNCKVAVLAHRRYEKPVLNKRYLDMGKHYGFEISPCGVRRPNEKGRVERAIKYIKDNLLRGEEFRSIEHANAALASWLDKTANVRIHSVMRKRPIDIFAEEKSALRPLPILPYDCSVWAGKTVNSQFRVVLESNKYSVPARLAGRRVELSILPDTVSVFHDRKLVASHARSYGRGQDIVDPEHAKPVLALKRKANAVRVTELFLGMGKIAADYHKGLVEKRMDSESHVRRILALTQSHGKDTVLKAMESAMEFDAFSSDYIANLIDMGKRLLPEPGPLQLSRKTDLLDLELTEPDMDLYDI